MSDPRFILWHVDDSVPDNLLGCPMCGAFVRWVDDRLTLREHRVQSYGQDCPASGTEGIDLGPRSHYVFLQYHLVFLGGKDSPKMSLQCPRCMRNVSPKAPPDGAFDRRLKVHIQCPDRFCRTVIALSDLREGPQGTWVTRGRRSDDYY